jgi:hypothetical protein
MEVVNKEENRFIEIMQMIHKSLSNAIRSAKADAGRAWLKQRGLTAEVTGACYNSGQIHHRKKKEFIEDLASVGFLRKLKKPSRTGEPSYGCFQWHTVVFPLKNEKGFVVNFFGVSTKNGKILYLNEQGIYPGYPDARTKRLYIVPTIMDAATLLESKTLRNQDSVMALFEGKYKEQHREVLKAFAGKLDEVIFIKREETEEP